MPVLNKNETKLKDKFSPGSSWTVQIPGYQTGYPPSYLMWFQILTSELTLDGEDLVARGPYVLARDSGAATYSYSPRGRIYREELEGATLISQEAFQFFKNLATTSTEVT